MVNKLKPWHRWLLLTTIAVLGFWIYRLFDLGQLLTLESLKNSRNQLLGLYAHQPALTFSIYFAIYLIATAASFPGAVILTLAGGALFGFWLGLLVVSFASSLGALLAFLLARYFLHDAVQSRFTRTLTPINEGVKRDGVFYLMTLRLVPIFPFWLVNLVMGLTPMTATRYYITSQIGMLPGTAVFVLAGTQLAGIESVGDVLSPGLVASLVLLGVFPILAKYCVSFLKRRKIYARWPKPKSFDRNLVVIGAGAGGLVTAYIAAAVKAKVTLIEGHKMGGDCLNYGCVPSKALIRSAKVAKGLRQATQFGFKNVQGEVDFAAVMQRVHNVIKDIEPHDSVERYTDLGVDVLQGHAIITSPWHVQVTLADGSQQTLTTKNIVIAAGAMPFVPPIPGLADIGFLTSDTIWNLTELPKRLVVLGGGPIGCELAQSFARLGSIVTQVEMAPRLLVREDPEVSTQIEQSLAADGVSVLVGHEAMRVEIRDGQKTLLVTHARPNQTTYKVIAQLAEQPIEFDEILVAVGRSARVTGYGLEDLGIELTARKTIQTNAYLQTLYPNIYAVGDVAGPFQLTHTAAHQAWYAAVNALFGQFKSFKADYSVIPWTIFTDPEVARVGLSESEAKDQGIAFEVTRFELAELDRAIADGSTTGFVKVLTVPDKDKILGATIVGEHAGDLLAEYVLAMRHGLGLNKILSTIHTYPTLAEANKYAAGQWKRTHAPQRLLALLEKLHRFNRSRGCDSERNSKHGPDNPRTLDS
ncbi:FAD-dependent oxidoreductase [Orrella daihaiensis]|uniref:FAD-dependent oxidoreductase n=1 Tax=Orrella daihaiensis TaxID=2782176 RepID=A0ABY4AIB9_9BURK|nr:bifunctional TVP38/TMEM64 family protein/FAD-dependent oxidoreductase [Orrella daihaiensis]UOD50042.1 FAD-dependent oxidoreductase [Orrella daihaiensis]